MERKIVVNYINHNDYEICFQEFYSTHQKEEIIANIKRFLCLRFIEKHTFETILNNLGTSKLIMRIERCSSQDYFSIGTKTIRRDGSTWIQRFSCWDNSSYNATTHMKNKKGKSKHVIMHMHHEKDKIIPIPEFDNWYLLLILYCLDQKHFHIFF